jgi:hypothetical protein
MLLAASAPQAAASPAAAPKAPKPVCRYEQELGTRIPVRVCRTPKEWEDMARQTQEDLRASRNQRHLPPND